MRPALVSVQERIFKKGVAIIKSKTWTQVKRFPLVSILGLKLKASSVILNTISSFLCKSISCATYLCGRQLVAVIESLWGSAWLLIFQEKNMSLSLSNLQVLTKILLQCHRNVSYKATSISIFQLQFSIFFLSVLFYHAFWETTRILRTQTIQH